jgi:hypothetical protein
VSLLRYNDSFPTPPKPAGEAATRAEAEAKAQAKAQAKAEAKARSPEQRKAAYVQEVQRLREQGAAGAETARKPFEKTAEEGHSNYTTPRSAHAKTADKEAAGGEGRARGVRSVAYEIYLGEMFVPYQMDDSLWYFRTYSKYRVCALHSASRQPSHLPLCARHSRRGRVRAGRR